MAQAIIARTQGDEYQARWFWMNVCRMFDDRSKVIRVTYEQENVKSFDDLGVFYKEGMQDEDGNPLTADYTQVKFHVTAAGAITWQGMTDPAFINASSISLLQRLKNAQQRYTTQGLGSRFYLYTPWSVHPDDLLASIWSQSDGRILWSKLAEGGPRSKMGKVRSAWQEHLGITTDEELQIILRPLRIHNGPGLHALGETLNLRLQVAGLLSVEEGCLIHPYDELTRKLLASGRTSFTKAGIEQICKQEKLWRGHSVIENGAYRMGIRSFLRWAEHLEDETDEMLCLLSSFNGRRPLSPDLWSITIFPQVEHFLSKMQRGQQFYHLHLHAHSSVAFAAGYCLDSKAGINVVPVQSTFSGPSIWRPANNPGIEIYPTWRFTQECLSGTGKEVALVIGVTHPIIQDVVTYLAQALPQIGRVISCVVSSGIGSSTILDGTHAKLLAQQLSLSLKELRTYEERQAILHLFTAAPNGFLFFLGQHARSFGRCVFYEYSFDGSLQSAYEPSLLFPPFPQHQLNVCIQSTLEYEGTE
jgi:hypothetical protein